MNRIEGLFQLQVAIYVHLLKHATVYGIFLFHCVILEKDLTKIAPETIRDVKIMATIVGGKIVFEGK